MSSLRQNCAISRIFKSAVMKSAVMIFATAVLAFSQVAVTTYHNDTNRTGWNSHETVLTPTTVASTSFGLLHNVALDDQVDGQPLLVPGVNITAGTIGRAHV